MYCTGRSLDDENDVKKSKLPSYGACSGIE